MVPSRDNLESGFDPGWILFQVVLIAKLQIGSNDSVLQRSCPFSTHTPALNGPFECPLLGGKDINKEWLLGAQWLGFISEMRKDKIKGFTIFYLCEIKESFTIPPRGECEQGRQLHYRTS